MADGKDHVHIVLDTETASNADSFQQLATTAIDLVGAQNVHLMKSPSTPDVRVSAINKENVLVEPAAVGGTPSIGFMGCHLYRKDPNAVMIWVRPDREDAAKDLQNNFSQLLSLVSQPGTMVSLGANEAAETPESSSEPQEPSGIYAWSVYALMESYRNYSPIDFQVLNEIVKVWETDNSRIEPLYCKLSREPITELLLNKVTEGYPTHHVFANNNSSMVSNRGGAVSVAPVFASTTQVDA